MDAIEGAVEMAYGLTDLACNVAGLNDFDLAMSNQAALIESEASLTRASIDAQTSIMQSEAAANRARQAMFYEGVYSRGGSGGKTDTIIGVCFCAAYFIAMLILTVALI